LTSSRQSKPA